MPILAFALARFSEPSSYAGLGALLALAGLHFSDSELGQLAQFLAAGCGLAALFLKERGIARMLALAVIAGSTLSACAPLVGAGAAAGALGGGIAIANQVAGAVDTTIQIACVEYGKGKAAANAVVAAGVLPAAVARDIGIIEQYGDAACANPPSGDAVSTAVWLGELVGQLGSLTSAKPAT